MASILVVDDEESIRKMLMRLLTSEGHTVHLASDGNEALQLYRAHHPDIVLTDIVMPDKEGIEMIHDLMGEFSDVKVIAMSGGGKYTSSESNLNLAKELGAMRVVQKPIDSQVLFGLIDELMSSSS